ncbi:MAG: DUF4338 domain-containing protein, partial [Opitutus sp.]|nr:DUF4338 domain-containing protein [Opitutus sp.]
MSVPKNCPRLHSPAPVPVASGRVGYSRPVGEHLKYLILAGDRPVACLAWSSAPLQLDLRDRFVGAPKAAYRHHLHQISYNSRYLILPWV